MTPAKPAAPRAVPAAGSQSTPWSLLRQLETSNRASIAATGDMEPQKLIPILEAALADPARREAVVEELATYLSRTLSGEVPCLEFPR